MDEYYSIIQALPEPMFQELRSLSPHIAPQVQELRLRAGSPLLFTIQGRPVPCTRYLPLSHVTAMLDTTAIQNCYLHLCRHSAYAYEEELRQGFLTIDGGNRVGVAGHWGPGCFTRVTSLNLRVARWVTCNLPEPLLEQLAAHHGGVLVAGAPGSGKTTFLRTLTTHYAQTGHIVSVIDERDELMPERVGGRMRPALPCDVYRRCPKAQAILMALRCMGPQWIVCDELGTPEEADAVANGVASGVRFVASVHCETEQELHKKPQLARLLQTGAFSTALFLDGRETPGTVREVVNLA